MAHIYTDLRPNQGHDTSFGLMTFRTLRRRSHDTDVFFISGIDILTLLTLFTRGNQIVIHRGRDFTEGDLRPGQSRGSIPVGRIPMATGGRRDSRLDQK